MAGAVIMVVRLPVLRVTGICDAHANCSNKSTTYECA